MRPLLLALVVLFACQTPTPSKTSPRQSTQQKSPAAHTPQKTSDLEYIEIVKGDPSQPLPLIVAVHGMGGSPENLCGLFDRLEGPARIILPKAPNPYNKGASWFSVDFQNLQSDAQGAAVKEAADTLALFLQEISEKYPSPQKPVLTGFSQGGMLSFTIAALHPEVISLAIPLAGYLPRSLAPAQKPAGAVPIRAHHGSEDNLLPVSLAQESLQLLQEKGFDVTLREYPGLGHSISFEMREALFALLPKK